MKNDEQTYWENQLRNAYAESETLRLKEVALRRKIAALEAAGDEMADTLNSTYTKEQRESDLAAWKKAKELAS